MATAQSVLDREFLEIRARVLELAAALDRLHRAGGISPEEGRMAAIRQGIEVLQSSDADRAERVQLIFSLPYEESWRTAMKVQPR